MPISQIAPYEEESALFVAWSWSSDGKRLAGYRRQQDGVNAGIVIYDFDTQKYERLTDFGRNPEWLADNRRLIFVGETEKGIYLVDSETKKWKQIAPEGAFTCPLSPDNRSIYTHIQTEEADIWLLTLSQ
jgi:Tol biopolymer transport system component